MLERNKKIGIVEEERKEKEREMNVMKGKVG
jgi:hypothetical protein